MKSRYAERPSPSRCLHVMESHVLCIVVCLGCGLIVGLWQKRVQSFVRCGLPVFAGRRLLLHSCSNLVSFLPSNYCYTRCLTCLALFTPPFSFIVGPSFHFLSLSHHHRTRSLISSASALPPNAQNSRYPRFISNPTSSSQAGQAAESRSYS